MPDLRGAVRFLVAMALAGCAAGEPPAGLPVAVLGDSDSHSYHDSLNGVARGGANNAKTYNWLELWERLRPAEVDPGPFERAGDSRLMALMKEAAGVPTRTPPKLDFLYNYAWSGARCASLDAEWPEQARRFLTRLSAEPSRWADGLVIIRIGINDFGQGPQLRLWARTPEAASQPVESCLDAIGATVAEIRKRSRVHIALVGIDRDYNAPFGVLPAADIAAAEAPLARFDAGLAALAARDPRIVFVEDAVWFEERFGTRADGTLSDAATIAGFKVANAVGDGPGFLHTADGHAGTIASGLFLQHLVRRLNEKFAWRLSAPSDEEIVALAQ
jgi:hypothetical protein